MFRASNATTSWLTCQQSSQAVKVFLQQFGIMGLFDILLRLRLSAVGFGSWPCPSCISAWHPQTTPDG